ncbi:hypothetical protein FIBSPDRAFT_967521 [Athelia psychrophila]|uniref:Uncharacterized protein n=1 Tax=Athelia psychrophila TaxID=1759441 RepID=A0A167VLW6_9AGAM|nr:hypothetical protein FIBSPDRAFT_967521 [Fibularhizoctonia sp. CBS 109695]
MLLDERMLLYPRYAAFLPSFSLDADADLRLSDKPRLHSRHRNDLRRLMTKYVFDYCIVPSEDAHQLEYVAETDISTGSSGQDIVSNDGIPELDPNWHDGPKTGSASSSLKVSE